MCDFGISETIAATSVAIAASTSSAASAVASGAAAAGSAIAAGASAAASGIAAGATAVGGALEAGIGALGSALGIGAGGGGGAAAGAGGATALTVGGGSLSDAALIASATGGSISGGADVLAIGAGSTSAAALNASAGGAVAVPWGVAEYGGLASLVLSAAGGGASAGVSAKQAKEQGTLIKAQAREEARNIRAQVNVEAQGNAQKNFELAAAALAARGEVNAANLGDRSVRAIGRAVGFQLGTDKATVKQNQELANSIASARLRGVAVTKQSARLQVGNPGVIAGVGAVNTLASGLNAGAGAYNAFSKFKIPTDGINLAFPS